MPKKRGIKREILDLEKDKRGASFGTIVAVIGAILIALGFAWLLAQNWHEIPSILKVIILVGLTSIAYIIAIVLREYEYPDIAKALFVVGALLYTLSVFLIAQTYSTSTSLQGTALLLLICWVGVIFVAYLFNSYTSLVIALIEFLFWINYQFIAFVEATHNVPALGYFSLLLLMAGIFFYGLSLLHNSFDHKFSKLYKYWTAFYFLSITFVLSFQYVVQRIWSGDANLPIMGLMFLLIFGVIAAVIFIAGIFLSFNKQKVSEKEILGIFIVIIVLIGLIFLTMISSNVSERSNWYGGSANMPISVWFVWIVVNIFFVLLILTVIGYGSLNKSKEIINLGISFFILDIATRYIGFLIDLGGYTTFSIIAIVGGISLIVLGFLISWMTTKWRKKLIEDSQNE